jgi:hypothetical protein
VSATVSSTWTCRAAWRKPQLVPKSYMRTFQPESPVLALVEGDPDAELPRRLGPSLVAVRTP